MVVSLARQAGRGHALGAARCSIASTSTSAAGSSVQHRLFATPSDGAAVPPVGSGSRLGSHRIVVVGGGAAGQAASHQLLRTGLFKDAADILIVDPSAQHDYQPGWTLVGAGLKSREELRRPMREVVGDDHRLVHLQDAVDTFQPEQSRLKTRDGREISYEHLVVCPGIGIKWDAIKNLEERLKEKRNVSSIYSYESCPDVYPKMTKLMSGKALFTQPAGVIKCAGAPQKIMWLSLDHWKKQGLYNSADPASSKVQITFATGMPTIFSAPKYAAALEQIRKERGVEGLYNHNLTSIDGNVATFSAPPAGEGDAPRTVQREFDFLHVTPPMGALPFIKNSPLADKTTGFVDVDAGTTRHTKYSNVWSVGDSSSLPTSKTAAAITSATPVMVANMTAAIQGRTPEEVYDGYTSCPLLTEYGKVMLAEFKYGGTPKESFNFLGIDQAVPQRAFYHLKKDFFPWVYYNSHVKGTWAGPKGWITSSPVRGFSTSARPRVSFPSTRDRRSFSTSTVMQRNTPVRRPRDPLETAPNAQRFAIPTGETFIVRPPPSSPSPLVPLNYVGVPVHELPALRPRRESTIMAQTAQKLGDSDIAQIKALRARDPETNTATVLARQYNSTPNTIRMVAPLSRDARQMQNLPFENKRAEWGKRKFMLRELRKERRSLW